MSPALIALLLLCAPEEDRTGSPHFVVKGGDFPLESTRTDVSIAGVIARVRVTQLYRNEGSQPIEATYVFPASMRAAVFGMRMRIGSRTIEAKIAERKAAQQKYAKAKQAGQTAALLEEERANVFTMRVANIMPGDRVETVLDYTELLVPEEGVYSFVHPTVVGPRYGKEEFNDNPYVEGAPAFRFELSAKIAAGMKIGSVASPSHDIAPRFEPNGVVHVDLSTGADRDFILEYRLDGGEIETGLLLHEGKRENYFLLMMQPPDRLAPSIVPPREYVFIVDVSGSMSGFPLDIAKETMRGLLERLRSEDRFNLLLFAGASAVMAPESLPATPSNIDDALQILEQQRGGGGTEILPALENALALPRTPEMSTSFVVLTDGFITVEPQVFGLIRDNLHTANVFAFGIGSSVNRHLIEGMARAGRGQPFAVTKPEGAEEEVAKFRRYIESPVLTHVQVAFEGFEAYDVEPPFLPDLFASRPVIVFGKYRGTPQGRILLAGTNAQGRVERALSVADYAPDDDLTALRWLWARDRIARLSDLASASEREDPELIEQVTRLGLAHSLLTAHTSFIAIDSLVRNLGGEQKSVRQPLSLPHGVSACELGETYPSFGSLRSTEQKTSTQIGGSGYGSGGGSGGYGSIGFGGRGKGLTRIVAGRSMMMGSLDKEEIGKVIRRNLPRFKFCYEKELNRSPELAGRISVRFTIGAGGKVTAIAIGDSTMGDEVVERCVLEVMRSLVFPSPRAGTVDVTYPFVFATAG